MSLKVELFAVAEGAVVSNAGQLSLFNVRPIFELPTFPANLRFSIALIATDDENPEPVLVSGRTTSVKFEIVDPAGSVMAAGNAQGVVATSAHTAAPVALQFEGDIVMDFDKPGVYEINMTVEVEGDGALNLRKELYVMQRPDPAAASPAP